jgi:hypothetical protein
MVVPCRARARPGFSRPAVSNLSVAPWHGRGHTLAGHLPALDRCAAFPALAGVFPNGNFVSDRFTCELLDAICAHPNILNNSNAEYLVEALETLVDMEPDRVCRVCHALLDQVGKAMGSSASSWSLRSDALVTIALTLQDMGKPHCVDGTALFERMLEFDLPYALEMLTDLDKRMSNRA